MLYLLHAFSEVELWNFVVGHLWFSWTEIVNLLGDDDGYDVIICIQDDSNLQLWTWLDHNVLIFNVGGANLPQSTLILLLINFYALILFHNFGALQNPKS